jgi:UDP-glucose 4-epimerase
MLEILTGGLHRLYGANVINTRIGLVYGPDDPNEHRLVPSVIKAFLRGTAPVLSSGRRRCDWIYVSDVAEALMHAALMNKPEKPEFDIGTGTLTSIRQVAEIIQGHVGTAQDPFIPTNSTVPMNRKEPPRPKRRSVLPAGVRE